MFQAGFEPTFSASERSQTHILDGAAAGIGPSINYPNNVVKNTSYEARIHVNSFRLKFSSLCLSYDLSLHLLEA